jgi:hypothetical protein
LHTRILGIIRDRCRQIHGLCLIDREAAGAQCNRNRRLRGTTAADEKENEREKTESGRDANGRHHVSDLLILC